MIKIQRGIISQKICIGNYGSYSLHIVRSCFIFVPTKFREISKNGAFERKLMMMH